MARFDFADRWNALFPKANKKLYERGQEAIKKGALLAGMGQTTVYTILRTTAFYKRSGYEAFSKKAEANGKEISWVQLRVIVERLEKNTEARTKVERILVQKSLTEDELEKLIDKLAPETIRRKSTAAIKEEPTPTQQFLGMIGSFKKICHARERFEQVLNDFNDNFEDTAEHAKLVLEQTSTLIGYFEEIHDFMDKKVVFITQLRDAAQKRFDKMGSRKAVKSSAENIRKQIAEEKAEHQKKESAKTAAMSARGDTDDVEVVDPYLDDENYDASDEELEEIDDEIQVDENNADIFDEIGNILDG
jgi:hypothetical protein